MPGYLVFSKAFFVVVTLFSSAWVIHAYSNRTSNRPKKKKRHSIVRALKIIKDSTFCDSVIRGEKLLTGIWIHVGILFVDFILRKIIA